MTVLKSVAGIGTVAVSLSVAAASAQDIASLKPGMYVRVGTVCQNPPASVMMNFDGKKFFGGRFCGVPEGRGASSKLKSCQSNDPSADTVSGIVTVLSSAAFSFKNGIGTFNFRYCSESELHGVAKSEPPPRAAPSPTDTSELGGLDPQTRMLVSMVLGQSQIKAIAFTGWETIKGPFSFIGATRQNKGVTVFVRTPDNTWVKVDCSLMDGGGGICFTASMLYTGFFAK